jgi:hypothetical protein
MLAISLTEHPVSARRRHAALRSACGLPRFGNPAASHQFRNGSLTRRYREKFRHDKPATKSASTDYTRLAKELAGGDFQLIRAQSGGARAEKNKPRIPIGTLYIDKWNFFLSTLGN